MMRLLFSITLLLGAALLFWIQLLASKMLLPMLGGSAAVWNTCLLFFQVALLLGYLYAHVLSRWRGGRLSVVIHPTLLLAAASVLPLTFVGFGAAPSDASPVVWLLRTLLIAIGPPFIVLAGTAPMLQAWFSSIGERSSQDPYFLYAASNLGSMGALASYPTVVEPYLRLGEQSRLWTIGYLLLLGLTISTGFAARLSWRRANHIVPDTPAPSHMTEAVSWRLRARWIMLAFVPSSLLLGVTNYLTTDVAAAPLFWVVPLFLYLLSFVLAFQRLVRLPERGTMWLQALLLVALASMLLLGQSDQPIPLFALHLAAFFMTALLCHQEVARLRPQPRHLTEFYLLLSFGGALGGLFNAIVAPIVFSSVVEYPLILAVACMLRPGSLPSADRLRATLADILLPVSLLALIVGLQRFTDLDLTDLDSTTSVIIVVLVALLVFSFQNRPFRFGLGVGALILAGAMIADTGEVLTTVRNFYGVLRVTATDSPPLHVLSHGTTTHGAQRLDAAHRLEPLSYYHSDGPLGQLFEAIGGSRLTRRVAVVGLGTGAIGCYAHPNEQWTFFEINPAVVAIARDPSLFTFLRDCPAKPNIVLGDARLSIAAAASGSFDLIILDAFNSDAIPIHLMTHDALQLYLTKLRPGGLLVFHISNRYLELAPVLGNIAGGLDLVAKRWSDEEGGDEGDGDDESAKTGKDPSEWVVVARRSEDLKPVSEDDRWETLVAASGHNEWTDDYSNVLSALSK